jgi:thymidylate synthase
MDHTIEESMLFHELNDNESYNMMSKSSHISVGYIELLRKFTLEEEGARNKQTELNDEIYGTDRISERIFANIQKYNHEEYQYLNILKNIMEIEFWEEGRNGKTKSIFGQSMRFSLKNNNIPILTTKKTAWKTCLKELLWFIRGETDNKILKAQGVHIWDANCSREFLDSRGLKLYPEDIIGPGYGYQWRNFGASYNCFSGKKITDEHPFGGVDQLQQIIDALKDPKQRISRRLVMTAWNPKQLDQMALPPCHILCQFNVHDGNKLSCTMYQRSCDFFLGSCFNIASYSLLTHLLAKHCGLEAYEFIYFMGNVHLYENAIDAAKLQISREPFEFPKVCIKEVKENINDYQVEDFELHNYQHHPQIKVEMVA